MLFKVSASPRPWSLPVHHAGEFVVDVRTQCSNLESTEAVNCWKAGGTIGVGIHAQRCRRRHLAPRSTRNDHAERLLGPRVIAHAIERVTDRPTPHVFSLPQTSRDPASAPCRRSDRPRREGRQATTRCVKRGLVCCSAHGFGADRRGNQLILLDCEGSTKLLSNRCLSS